MEQYTSEDARREWRRILNAVEHGDQVEITRYGKPLAVVVPVEWRDTVVDYISATTFTREAAAFYAARKAGGKQVPVTGEPSGPAHVHKADSGGVHYRCPHAACEWNHRTAKTTGEQ